MKSNKLVATVAATAIAATGLGLAGAAPASACTSRSNYEVAGMEVIAKDGSAVSPNSGGPVYVDFRKYDAYSGGSKSAGVQVYRPARADTGDVYDAALDTAFAPINFWIYVETNGTTNLQRGNAKNPAYVALENQDDGCGTPSSNPDTVLY